MRAALRWDEVRRQMGERYNACTFQNYDCRDERQAEVKLAVVNYLRQWPEHQRAGRGMFLYGPRGGGKTHLASAALTVAARTFGSLVAWADGQTLFAKMRDTIGRDASEEAILAPLIGADVTLIDDPIPPNVDRSVTDFQLSVLWRLIDARYRRLRPVWVTLNVSSEQEAVSRLGGQLVDRLIDGSLCLKCNFPSARKPLP